jgi:molybdopterin converting factor small subunit
MPTVYIPSLLQNLTGGKGQVEARGSTVRDVIHDLEKSHPGVRDRLIDNGQLRANISVAVDGEITPLGLLEEVNEDSEIHFVAAIKGGLRLGSRGLHWGAAKRRGDAMRPA